MSKEWRKYPLDKKGVIMRISIINPVSQVKFHGDAELTTEHSGSLYRQAVWSINLDNGKSFAISQNEAETYQLTSLE